MKKHSLIILVALIVLFSCKKHSDNPLWNIQALAPLVQTSLTLNNIIKDTSSIKKASDNSLSIVMRESVANINENSLVTLNVTPYTKKVKLSTLVLADQTVKEQITLGQLARALVATGTFTNVFAGNFILGNQNQTVTVPPISNISSSNLPLSIQQFFDNATFLSGSMDIQLKNDLPLPITQIHFNVKNPTTPGVAAPGATIADQTFTNLNPGDSLLQTVDLSNKTVDGNLLLNLLTLDLSGGPALIDTNAAIVISITIRNVSLQSATAVFPTQNVINSTQLITLAGTGEVQLYEAMIASGNVVTTVNSTIGTNMLITYSIPGATLNGSSYSISKVIPAASNGVAQQTLFSVDFSGYTMNLRGPLNDTVNTFSNTIVANMPYTGQKVFITLNDSVDVTINFSGIKPSYVKGYLGRDTIQVGPSTTSLNIFNKIQGGTLNFQSAKMTMVVENGLGVAGAVKINNVVAKNKKGDTLALTGPNIGTLINIPKATDNPLTIAVDSIDLSTGSNAVNLLSLLPNQITYNVMVIANPAGNTGTYSDFAYATSGLNAYLDIEMPLSFFSSSLVLSDTASFNSTSLKKKSVNEGTFTVNVTNGFPLTASLQMYLLDQNNNLIDSLVSSNSITAAPINSSTNRVTQPVKSSVAYNLDANQMHNVYNSSKIIFKVTFTTLPMSTFVKIYSDYSIDFSLVGDMNYSVYK
ncbi:MAG TPA: hypothetical protein VK766_02840 [Cytophagaceae bacterium]|jgi:hypothetical protein|nr:hypothetical protein [Cytophagaceae bacterium]